MNTTISIVINVFVLISAAIGILTSVGVLFLVFYHRRQHPVNPPVFLVCNTCISILFLSIILFDMYAHHTYGDLHDNMSFDHSWCYLRAYFVHVSFFLFYQSYLIQAVFRFFRVVFYKHKYLQTLRFMFQLVLIQWLFDALCILPLLILHHFQYISEYYYCEILLTDSQGMFIMGAITYSFPMISMQLIYSYILYHMKKKKSQSTLQNRQQANKRDFAVIRRILIVLGTLFLLGFPTFIIWCTYLFTGYANPLGYRLGWSLFTLCISTLPTISVVTTPQLRQLFIITWRRHHRVQPATINNL